MYEFDPSVFNHEMFLRDYWQKKPVIIRQGFKNFVAPINANEVAGLACEEDIESRLIYRDGERWKAESGPFTNFEKLGDKGWSLVIQALDNWSEAAAQLLEPFRFIPNWRLDDLMVSFATPEGGVGPHIDSYDTFICQGTGVRNWRVGDKGDHTEFAAHAALLHVEPFEAIIDSKVYPGDILYIPPGFPHDGVTLEASLSFSIGFKTNSTTSLMSGLADFLIDNELSKEQIEDPHRLATNNSGAIDSDDFLLIKKNMLKLLENDALMRTFAGTFLSDPKHELDLAPEDEPFSYSDINQLLKTNCLMRLGGLKAFYFTDTIGQGIIYVGGHEYHFSPSVNESIKLMCDHVTLTPEMLENVADNVEYLEFLGEMLEAGYWYFSDN
ncbi:cupin [Endozoicomonas sp. (ex Bugula neritina AB1)]|nr:cupin [Endozoicomonas sp. (ex Bugula neritina AB1)]